MNQLLSVVSDALPEGTHVVSFVGREALSEPYVFHIGLEINDEGFDPDEALRAPATLRINLGDGTEPHRVCGILVAVELLHQYVGKALYRATLVPKLWLLRHAVHSRIYTDATIIEIITAVLQASGLTGQDFRFQVLHGYPKLEHVCQYKESNLEFLSRWMEREGLYYFFEHGPDGEELVITDSGSFHGKLDSGSVRYVPLSGSDSMALEAFDSFMARHSALPAEVRLTDYDYLHPKLDLQGKHGIDTKGTGVVQLFGEHLRDTSEGKRYARVRAEEFLAGQKVFHGHGRVFTLRPNYRFTLEEHPNTTYNGKSYLVTELEHVGNQSATEPRLKRLLGIADAGDDEYAVQMTAIPADVQYRSARRHPWPRVDGYELATVCGEAESEYAQIDEHGRYKCRVMFDESDLVDGSATTYIRMMQPHGGGIEGFHFPLRKGTEILLFFLAGDPDRPVIAGAAPNPLKPSPVTSANHTRNVIQTGGRNRLELEDLAGQQRITLSTPYSNTYLRMGSPNEEHELIVKTDDNTLLHPGKNFDLDVGHNGGGSWTATIADNWRTTVERGVHELTVSTGSSKTDVKRKVTEIYQDEQETTVTKLRKSTYHLGQETTVNAALCNETYNAGHETTVTAGGQKNTVTGGIEVTCTDSTIQQTAQGDITIESTAGLIEITGKNAINIKSDGPASIEVQEPWYERSFGGFFKFNFAVGVGLTVGASSETFIGLKNENKFGGLMEITGALKLETSFGMKIDLNSAMVYEGRVSWLDTASLKLDNVLGPKLKNAAVHLARAGIHIHM